GGGHGRGIYHAGGGGFIPGWILVPANDATRHVGARVVRQRATRRGPDVQGDLPNHADALGWCAVADDRSVGLVLEGGDDDRPVRTGGRAGTAGVVVVVGHSEILSQSNFQWLVGRRSGGSVTATDSTLCVLS